jgi:hypothetical protein
MNESSKRELLRIQEIARVVQASGHTGTGLQIVVVVDQLEATKLYSKKQQ